MQLPGKLKILRHCLGFHVERRGILRFVVAVTAIKGGVADKTLLAQAGFLGQRYTH